MSFYSFTLNIIHIWVEIVIDLAELEGKEGELRSRLFQDQITRILMIKILIILIWVSLVFLQYRSVHKLLTGRIFLPSFLSLLLPLSVNLSMGEIFLHVVHNNLLYTWLFLLKTGVNWFGGGLGHSSFFSFFLVLFSLYFSSFFLF